MSNEKIALKLNPIQINLLSFLLIGPVAMAVLVLLIGYRDTRIGLLGVGGLMAVGLGIMTLYRPQMGVYVLAITIFTNISAIFVDSGLPGINKPLVVLIISSVVVGRLARRQSFHLKPTEWFLMAYGGVWLASAVVARDRSVSFTEFVDFVKEFLIILAIVYSVQKQIHWKRIVWIVIISVTMMAALGAYQVVTGNFDATFSGFAMVTPDEDQMRLSGPVGDPNFFGQILSAVMTLVLYRFFTEKNLLLRVAAGISTLLIIFAIINTYSRGAFVAMLLVFTLTVIERGVNIKKIILISVMILFVIPLLMPFLPKGFSERMQTLSVFTSEDATVHEDASFKGRSSEMLSGLLMFLDSPFLGIGIGNYEEAYHDYAVKLGLEHRTERRQAHSLYVEIIAETGLLGLVTFAAIITSLFMGFKQIRRQTRIWQPDSDWPIWVNSLQIAIVSYLTTSIFLHGDFFRYLLFLVAMGAAAIHLNDTRPKSYQKVYRKI
jgi:putative inorganic carbon (HCO3(-)) transporter